MSTEYEIFYPNVFSEEERRSLDDLRMQLDKDAEESRKKLDIPEETEFDMEANSYEMAFYANAWDPYNPLFNDKAYARKTKYGDIIAIPGLYEPRAMFPPMPKTLGDLMGGPGLDHDIFFFAPIYGNDTFFTVIDKQEFQDVTAPKGNDIRAFKLAGHGSLYNQKNEMVVKTTFRATECFQRAVDPAKRGTKGMGSGDWSSQRPIRHYMDEDWEYIKELWKKEYIRGSEVLYWEDVNIGDEPTWTCDGPITAMHLIQGHCLGLKNTPHLRDMLLNPVGGGMLYRDPYGIYHGPMGGHFETQNRPDARPTFYNHTGRNFTIRMLTNWMGDNGFLCRISWHIISQFMEDFEGKLDPDPERPGYIYMVPYLKDKSVNIHGMSGDLSISKAYVVKKYTEDDRHLIDLVCWCETIDGDIFSEGYATVRLPSRKDK